MPNLIRPCLLAAALLMAGAGDAVAQEVPMPRPKAPPSPEQPRTEQIQVWIDQLDADEFLTRETAMLKLVAAGENAIPVLKSALATNNLETLTRGLFVLEQLGLSSDLDLQEQARAALADLADAREHATSSRRARAVLGHLIAQRSDQALSELQALGAKVTRAEQFDGFAVTETVEAIQIGPEFKGSVAELRRLKWLTVSRLVLAGEQVTDEWLAQAADMKNLEELHVYQAKITDAGLAPFVEHPSIEQVGIYYTPVGEAALDHLKKLPALNFVKLFGTRVSKGALEQFVQAAGLAAVDHRRGAFLGVGCMTVDNACMLSTVHVGSPAERAGLIPDDVLLRFGEGKVTDFKALTALIAELDVGEAVEVEVQRQTEDERGDVQTRNVTTKVTFSPWPVEVAVRNAPPQ